MTPRWGFLSWRSVEYTTFETVSRIGVPLSVTKRLLGQSTNCSSLDANTLPMQCQRHVSTKVTSHVSPIAANRSRKDQTETVVHLSAGRLKQKTFTALNAHLSRLQEAQSALSTCVAMWPLNKRTITPDMKSNIRIAVSHEMRGETARHPTKQNCINCPQRPPKQSRPLSRPSTRHVVRLRQRLVT